MGNGSVGRDSSGFWAEIIMVEAHEFLGTRIANKCEMRNMRNVFLVNS